MYIEHDNMQSVIDRHFAIKCPRCGVLSNLSVVSVPIFSKLYRYKPNKIGIVYRCDSCNDPVFLRFTGQYRESHNDFRISETYEEIERPQQTFDFKYLPEVPAQDFREALACYSNCAYNGFAAMCRRTVQSVSADLGAEGSDKVLRQLKDLKEMAQIDDETFGALKQIVIDGHDGAHPHLPNLNAERAAVLLELMKDVLYQIYVRQGKLKEAMALRKASIQEKK